MTEPIRAIDFCAGAGGWAVASRGLPIEWVAVADKAADCLETWGINHGAAHPDCRLVQCDLATPEGLAQVLKAAGKRIDLIVGGIPCEQVSTARGNKPLRNGELGSLHSLIDNLFELVRLLRPRWWAIEDVEAILPHLPSPLVSGIPCCVRKIDASEYGPQRRHRVFFGSYPWPIAPPEPGPRTLGDVLRPGPYRTLSNVKRYERTTGKWYGGMVREQDPQKPAVTVTTQQGKIDTAMVPLVRVLDSAAAAPVVVNGQRHERGHLVGMPTGAMARNLDAAEPAPTVSSSFYCDERTVQLDPQPAEEPARTVLASGSRDAVVKANPPSIQDRPQDAADAAPTVVAGHGDRCWTVEDAGQIRVLEWQEAAALQGFPPDFVFAASWSRTWKLLAQAIPIQVGRAILQAVAAEAEVPVKRKRKKVTT